MNFFYSSSFPSKATSSCAWTFFASSTSFAALTPASAATASSTAWVWFHHRHEVSHETESSRSQKPIQNSPEWTFRRLLSRCGEVFSSLLNTGKLVLVSWLLFVHKGLQLLLDTWSGFDRGVVDVVKNSSGNAILIKGVWNQNQVSRSFLVIYFALRFFDRGHRQVSRVWCQRVCRSSCQTLQSWCNFSGIRIYQNLLHGESFHWIEMITLSLND